MIFVTDKGRMANNIFQYGQLYAWGREHGRRTLSMRFAHKYPDFRITNEPRHNFAVYLIAKMAAKLGLMPTVAFNQLGEDVERQQQAMLTNRHVLVTGWCVRFPDLFEKYRDEIVSLFDFKHRVRRHVAATMSGNERGTVTLGIHIRRGDYRCWCDGRYYFDDREYISVARQFMRLHEGRPTAIYICTNDPLVDRDEYRRELSEARVVFPDGTPAEDLCLLSECDYIVGPPSTFTLVASMYRDAPLYWMADGRHELRLEDFHTFDYQARHFDNYYTENNTLTTAEVAERRPLITLITAVYNTADYLRECIDSVVAQTYDNWELLLVDDGSTDGSGQICDEYAAKDSRIKVVHKKNSGKADACNMAIKMAKGEYIGFVDSDDWVELDMLQSLLTVVLATGKDAVACGYMNEFVGETTYDPLCRQQTALTHNEVIAMIYDRRLYGYMHGRLFRRELLVEPVPQLRRYEDFAVIYKWLSHGNGLTLCPRNLYHYRQRQSSIMNSMDDRMFGFIKLLEEVYHFIKENHVLPERQNKALAVKNCMRIAKDIARNAHGKKNTVRLYDIRETLNRLSPITYLKSDLKLRWRVWLLRHSIVGFKGAVRLDQLFVTNHQENDRTFYK